MKKELSAKEYVMNANGLLDAARIVASNLAFNAAGLAAGEEEVHHKKLLMSLVNLRVRVEGLLRELPMRAMSSMPNASSREKRSRCFWGDSRRNAANDG